MSSSSIQAVLADLERALGALEAALADDDAVNLGPASAELARRAVELGELVSEGAPVSDEDRVLYRALLPRVEAVMAGCAWRAMLVSQLLRDLGVDLGLYGPDGVLDVIFPERSSQLA